MQKDIKVLTEAPAFHDIIGWLNIFEESNDGEDPEEESGEND